MISVLKDANESVTAVLAGAPATTQPNYSLLWNGNGGPGQEVGALTGVTAKTMLSGVAGGPRVIDSLHVYNADTAALVAQLAKVINGTSYPLVNAQIPVGGTLRWLKDGLSILDAGGTTPAVEIGAVVAGIGVVATESGSGNFRKTRLTLTNTPITITDALAYAGLKLYDFPAGRINVMDCVANLTFTTTSAIASTLNSGVTCNWGIGSVTASAVTLATTMMNFMPGSGETVKTFVSSTVINVAPAAVTGFLAAVSAAHLAAIVNGTATAADLFLNVSVVTATDIDADATLAVNGTIDITWVNGGDL